MRLTFWICKWDLRDSCLCLFYVIICIIISCSAIMHLSSNLISVWHILWVTNFLFCFFIFYTAQCGKEPVPADLCRSGAYIMPIFLMFWFMWKCRRRKYRFQLDQIICVIFLEGNKKRFFYWENPAIMEASTSMKQNVSIEQREAQNRKIKQNIYVYIYIYILSWDRVKDS